MSKGVRRGPASSTGIAEVGKNSAGILGVGGIERSLGIVAA